MYLDNAASTPIADSVKRRAIELLEIYGNPSSQHEEGYKAHRIIEDAKNTIACKLNCKAEEINFTSGATMSNNVAIQGYLRSNPDAVLIISAVEHNDIMMLFDWIQNDKYIISVDNNGYLNLNELEVVLNNNKDRKIICSIQMANSETGVIQDIKSIAKLVHLYGGVLHTDATQYIPYYKTNVNELDVDMLSMSGQKIGCIKGTGLLYVKQSIKLTPIIFGEQGLIGGTENVIGIGCLAEAFEHIDYNYTNVLCRRDEFINLLDGKLVGSHFNRLPNNVNVMFEGVSSENLLYNLNEQYIFASGGSACSSTSGEPSHVLLAMGYSEDEANCCVRFTLPSSITTEQIESISKTVNKIYKLLKG